MTWFTAYYRAAWSGRSWTAYTYLLLGLPLGILWGVYTLVMLAVGVSLVIIVVGVLILVGMLVTMRPIGASERHLANGLIRADIPAPHRRRTPEPTGPGRVRGAWRWSQGVLKDGHAWRVAAWALLRLVLGPIGFAVGLVGVVVPIAIVGAILQSGLIVLGWGDWMTDADSVDVAHTVAMWVLVGTPVLLLVLPMFAWASRGLATALVPLARWALGAREVDRVAEVIERATRAEEQVRIDQELHDSIGHMITMNIVQAGAGAHVFDTDPEFARRALQNIEERGRAAMGELDRIIATIRGDDAPLAPLADYLRHRLARSYLAARGHGGDLHAWTRTVLPGAIERTAFSVVREALTNAARHAPGATVDILVSRDGDALGIAVINGPPGAAVTPTRMVPSSEHGLAGIRDRVALLGGRTAIGPENGGFAVRALIPLETELSVGDPGSQWAPLRARDSGAMRIVIADDDPLVRMGLRAILSSEPGWEVVAEAGDGEQALAAVREHVPDVVLMDVRMPDDGRPRSHARDHLGGARDRRAGAHHLRGRRVRVRRDARRRSGLCAQASAPDRAHRGSAHRRGGRVAAVPCLDEGGHRTIRRRRRAWRCRSSPSASKWCSANWRGAAPTRK